MRIRTSPALILAFACAACGTSNTPSDIPEDLAGTLTEDQLIRLCQLGHGFRVGRDPDAIDAKYASGRLVRLSYVRDDGKSFRYDCKAEGNVLYFRMIDEAGPSTGPGTWSGVGSQTTYDLSPGKVTIRDFFSDGSTDQKTFDFQ